MKFLEDIFIFYQNKDRWFFAICKTIFDNKLKLIMDLKELILFLSRVKFHSTCFASFELGA